MATTVDELLIRIEADTKGIRRDMARLEKTTSSNMKKMEKSFDKANRAVKRMGKFMKSVQKTGQKLGRIFSFVIAGALAIAVRRSLAFADRIAKVADKIGFTTDQLQELRFAATLAGVDVRILDLALQRFSRRIGEVAKGQGELLKVAQRYNVQLFDSTGKMRSNIAILKSFANIVKKSKSSQEQLRISFKLFDSEGAALVNLMRQGAAGIDRFSRKARALGLVMDEDLIRGAEKANDALTIMFKVIQLKLIKAIVTLAPEIARLANEFTEAIPEILKAVEAFGKFIGLLDRSPEEKLSKVTREIRRIGEAMKNVGTGSTLIGQGPTGPTLFDIFLERIFNGRDEEQLNKLRQKLAEAKAIQSELKAAVSQKLAQQLIDDPNLLKVPGTGGGGRGVPKDKTKGMSDSVKEALQFGEELNRQRLEAIANGQAILEIDNQRSNQLTQLAQGPQGEYNRKLAEANRLLSTGQITTKSYQKQVERLGETLLETNPLFEIMNSTLGAFSDGIVDAFINGESAVESFAEVMKNAMAEVAKSLLRAAIAALIARAFGVSIGGGGGGGIGGAIFSGISGLLNGGGGGGTSDAGVAHNASGGPVQSNKPTFVGERGMELFVPQTAGKIIPNKDLGGGGIVVNQTINVTTGVQATVRAEIMSMRPMLRDDAIAATIGAARRSHAAGQAFQKGT